MLFHLPLPSIVHACTNSRTCVCCVSILQFTPVLIVRWPFSDETICAKLQPMVSRPNQVLQAGMEGTPCTLTISPAARSMSATWYSEAEKLMFQLVNMLDDQDEDKTEFELIPCATTVCFMRALSVVFTITITLSHTISCHNLGAYLSLTYHFFSLSPPPCPTPCHVISSSNRWKNVFLLLHLLSPKARRS
jgi:hypothetical protein